MRRRRIRPAAGSGDHQHDISCSGITGTYSRRDGLLIRQTDLPGNSLSITSRAGSNGQTELTRRWFYEPLFNRVCATIERRGNAVDGSTYFTPQNGGSTPTDSDRSRYATITYYDYQKDATGTVTGDAALQTLLDVSSADIGNLIDLVDGQMTDTGGAGGIPAGFEMDLGDINGDAPAPAQPPMPRTSATR